MFDGLPVPNSTAVECIGIGADREIFITPFGFGSNGPERLGVYGAEKLDGEFEYLGDEMKSKWIETLRYIDGVLFACTAENGLYKYE